MFKIIIPLNQVSLGKVGPDEKTTGQDTKDFKVSNTHIDTLNETLENRIINLIKQNPSSTQKTISEILEVSLGSVKRTMKRLADSDIISRKSGKRNGYWIVVNTFN